MTAEQLSRDLREGKGKFLRRRRGVVGLSLISMGSMALVALYQMGILKRVPEPRLRGIDADKVNGSPQAYSLFKMPDAVLGIGSYAATMALASMGGEDRASEYPWIPLAMAAKAGLDALNAAKLTFDEATKYKAFCSWCLLATAATLATVPLVVPEARAAVKRFRPFL